MHNWKPWEEYADANLVDLPIEEPPCKHCKYWNPQRMLSPASKSGQIFTGIQCCWVSHGEQRHDFSCYKPREPKDPRTSPPTEWHTGFDRSVECWGAQEAAFDRGQSPTFTGRIVYPRQAEEETEEWSIGDECWFWLETKNKEKKMFSGKIDRINHKARNICVEYVNQKGEEVFGLVHVDGIRKTKESALKDKQKCLEKRWDDFYTASKDKTEQWSIGDKCCFFGRFSGQIQHGCINELLYDGGAMIRVIEGGTPKLTMRDKGQFWKTVEQAYASPSSKSQFHLELPTPKPATPSNPQTLDANGKFVDAAEWQPIETAPKDGTIILANHKDWDTPKVRHWKEAQVDGLFYWGIPYERDSELAYLDKEDLPTHWVPIPPFPTIENP